MDKKILKEVIKQAWFYTLSYFTHYLFPIIKDALEETKDYFINIVWEALKEEFTIKARASVKFVKHFFTTLEYEEKEKAAIDTLFKNINLPLPLRPFKPLLKKILRKKIHELISELLDKLEVTI